MAVNVAGAKSAAAAAGLVIKDPIQKELDTFEASFQRQFAVPFAQRPDVIQAFAKHQTEILLGLMVAKEQFAREFDGETPAGGKFGMTPIPAAALGVGDDWDSHPSVTGGAAANWIHSGTTLMGGTAGNNVRIGKNSVLVIVAYASQHPSPKVERLIPRIDGKDKPYLYVNSLRYGPGGDNLQIRELDNAYVLKKDTEIRIQVFQSVTGIDIPVAVGAWFAPEDKLRVYDPVNLPGTTNDVIVTT